MRKALLISTMLATFALTACSGGGAPSGGSNGPTITMAFGAFSGNTSITIKAGDAVTFDDSSGGAHELVIGSQGHFTAVSGAPSQLNSATGVMFNGGDKQTIVFANAGSFPITCLIHPSMQATITVTS